jgi:hypothetical protein
MSDEEFSMIDLERAERMALEFINKEFDWSELDDQIVLMREKTVEVERGWVFYYNSETFLKTKDFSFMLMGNNPVIVMRLTGDVTYIQGGVDIEEALREL